MRRAQVVAAVLILGTGLTGQASASAAASNRAPTDALPHCVVTAVEADAAPTTAAAPRCFATFAEAVAEATEGRVRVPANARTLDQATLDAANAQRSPGRPIATVIGIEYEHKYFGGWSYLIQSTNVKGCAGYSYKVPSLPSSRNDEISSARSYGGCKSRHFSGTNLTGSTYLCGCSQMGTMNDRTSSIFLSATGYRA